MAVVTAQFPKGWFGRWLNHSNQSKESPDVSQHEVANSTEAPDRFVQNRRLVAELEARRRLSDAMGLAEVLSPIIRAASFDAPDNHGLVLIYRDPHTGDLNSDLAYVDRNFTMGAAIGSQTLAHALTALQSGESVYSEATKGLATDPAFRERTISEWTIPDDRGHRPATAVFVVYGKSRPVPNEDEKRMLKSWVGLAADLIYEWSNRKEPKASEDPMRHLLGQNQIGCALVSRESLILQANAKFYESLGWNPTDTPADLRSLLGGEDRGLRRLLDEAADSGVARSREIRIHRVDGTSIWLDWTVVSLETPENAGEAWIYLVENISTERTREERYQEALVSAGIGVWEFDGRSQTFELSEMARKLLGEGVRDKESYFDFIQRIEIDGRRAFEREFRWVVEHEGEFSIEFPIRRENSLRWLELKGRVRLGPRRTTICVCGMLTDVTERKRDKDDRTNQRRWLQVVLDRLPMPLLLLEPGTAHILFANRSAEDFADAIAPFGTTLAPGRSEPSERAFCTDADGRVLQEDEMPGIRAARGERLSGTEIVWHAQGRSVPFLVHSERLPALYGQPESIALAFTDVRRLKETESEMKRAKEAAEAANAEKTRFLANMSHEIRTPLGVIVGFTKLLSDPTLAEEDRFKFLRTIDRNADLLSQLIGDILDVSKVEAGQVSIEHNPVRLRELITDITEVMEAKAKEKGLRFQMSGASDLPEVLLSDRLRIQQILYNIIGNAIKFTNQGGVSVELSHTKIKEGHAARLRFIVRDTGIGIAPERQQRLFHVFSQADDSMTRRYGGTGLGLALSQKLARLLGGDVELLESRLGVGTAIKIEIEADLGSTEQAAPPVEDVATAPPVVGVAVGQPVEGVAVAPQPRKKTPLRFDNIRLLVVDDSPDNQTLIRRLLEKRGAVIELAENGKQAVEMVAERDFEAIVMDIQMPVMDGYEAAHTLRENGYQKPILALTAHAMKEDREKALQSGFDDYITKPVEAAVLFQVVSQHLHDHQKLEAVSP